MEQFIMNNLWVIIAVALWSLPWKGVALWKAGQRGDLKWFIALLLINTLGLLEMLYIFVYSKRGAAATTQQ